MAQKNEKRVLNWFTHADESNILDEYNLPKQASDSITLVGLLNEFRTTLQRDGYLLVNVDSLKREGAATGIFVSVGEKFKWAVLEPGNLDEAIISGIGYKEKFYTGKPFNYLEVSKLLKRVITYSENHGYPFASIRLDSISIENQKITASLNYNKGPLITFDTVALVGDTKTKPLFISSYLRIKPGAVYEEKKIAQASNRLNRLPYIRLAGSPHVTFQLKEGTPHFNFNDVRANQIDGIIGLLPNEGVEGKALITGQFNLLLQNIFGTGKKISLRWQRPEVNSQTLDVLYGHPNLFKSSINLQAAFSLLKEDTLFINRNLSLEASLLIGRFGNLKAYSDWKVARVIGDLETNIGKPAAELADFDLNQYGLGYDWSDLNNNFVPSKGTVFNLEVALGNKTVQQNDNIGVDVDDSVQLKSVQYNLEGAFSKYFLLKKRLVLKTKISAGSVIGDQLFTNDLYRIGGLNSLRGFVENEFFASSYAIGTLEAQLLLDNESYLFFFFDQGYLSNSVRSLDRALPAGLGTGLSFSTNAGIFTFVYALGKTEDQPFSINFSKIHFGYITRF